MAVVPQVAPAWQVFPALTEPIRQEISRVETELASLPLFPVNTSPWTLGYSSAQHQAPDMPVRIDIEFEEPAVVDLVALIPAAYTDQNNEVRAFGFPVRFCIERVLPDGKVDRIADFLERDYPEPGIDPQLFPCRKPEKTTGLRITVIQAAANPTWWHATHLVALSECYAFADERNIALNGTVSANSSFEFSYVWSMQCLTDGFSLFSPIYHDLTDPEDSFSIDRREVRMEIDLGESRRVDELRLWPVVHSVQHNFPPSSGAGFPKAIRLESSQTSDFSDPRLLYQEKRLAQRPGSGPYMHRTTPSAGRYLRLTLSDGLPDFRQDERKHIALSEIQLLENGKTVSVGKEFHIPDLEHRPAYLKNLSDGRSNEGVILPLRQWVGQFKRRVELENRLGILRLQLDDAQREEEKRSRTILLSLVGLVIGLLQLVWLVRLAARRRWERMRERIASDLHDEVGANVSSMAHTAELIAETIKVPSPTQSRLLGNLVESARLTSRETKHFIRFIEGESHSYDIAEQFTLVADQILGTISTTFSLENTRSFNALDPATKWNLLLFYKEALNNIIKHADADMVTISAGRRGGELLLEVVDNGRGMAADTPSCRHLEERAAMLRGRLEIESQPDEGTRIRLHFKQKRKT